MQLGYGAAPVDVGKPADSLSFKPGFYESVTRPSAFYPVCSLKTSAHSHVPSFFGYIPDTKSIANVWQSCIKRFGCEMPKVNDKDVADFEKFSALLFRTLLKPIDVTSIPSIEEWLATTNYNQARKDQLMRAYEEADIYTRKLISVQGFGKFESYMDIKTMRTINSPSDASKVLVAGAISKCDKALFALRYFVKGTDPTTYPAMLKEALPGRVSTTDFSSMESHHQGRYARVVKDVYFYLLSESQLTKSQRALLGAMFCGTREIGFGPHKVRIGSRLMSGAQWTSGANSILNFSLIAYMVSSGLGDHAQRVAWIQKDFLGKFEGDDGIFDARRPLDMALCARLGLKLKIETHPSVETAGFCGMYLAPDEDQVLKEPLKALCNFFAMPMKYYHFKDTKVLGLLRARALSYQVQYQGCPIIGPLSKKILDLTASIDVRGLLGDMESHKQKLVLHGLEQRVWLNDQRPILISTRARYEELFNMSVDEQFRIEKCIAEMTLEGGVCDLMHHWGDAQYATVYRLLPEWDQRPLDAEFLASDAPEIKAKPVDEQEYGKYTEAADKFYNRQAVGHHIQTFAGL